MLGLPSFNTVSVHSTAFDHCTVRYGTGPVGRYGHIYSYLNSSIKVVYVPLAGIMYEYHGMNFLY